ncbi:MAG: adenosylcobinamide-GDP ribazoletransferase [Candidatus Binataceae bacterium]|nr:adenosylcobinamide-GDP ribazoletransferase [Candidatus Binataceae bacterium]
MSDAPDDGSANAPRRHDANETNEANEAAAPLDTAADATAGLVEPQPDSGGKAETDSDHGFDLARWLSQIRLATSFLTILPVGAAIAASPAEVAASFGWFPLLGFGIGLVLCAIDWALAAIFGNAMRAVLIVLILTVLTGALHLDGLADTADALGAGRDRTRVLEILRDSRIGSFGAIALVFVIVLKAFALAGASGAPRYAAIYMAPGLGRWAMVALASGLEYLRPDGAGAAMLSHDRRRNLKIATLTAMIAIAPLMTLHALRACVVAALVSLAMRSFYSRWVGGVTGDLIGAAGEIVETAVLIAVTL